MSIRSLEEELIEYINPLGHRMPQHETQPNSARPGTHPSDRVGLGV